MIIGSPSRYFTNWYFYYPEHLHRYPNLGNTYINHYYGRRRTAGGNSSIVDSWVRERRGYFPKDFATDRSRRPEVIRQVAQLDIDARIQFGRKPVSRDARDQYFGKNVSKYPSLDGTRKPKRVERQNDIPESMPQPEKQPAVRIIRPAQVLGADPASIMARRANRSDAERGAAQQPGTRRLRPSEETDVNPRSTVPSPVPKSDFVPVPTRQRVQIDRRATPPPAYNFNRMNKAQEYQRNIWEQAQPSARPQPPPRPVQQAQPAPRPQVQQPVRQAPAPRNRSRDK